MVVRYFHLEKYAPFHRVRLSPDQLRPVAAMLAGADTAAILQVEERQRARLRDRAEDLVADPQVCAGVRDLPFVAGDVIVALGDSITDDRLSWAELLAELLHLVRPADRVRMVNLGVTGNTTGELISRIDTVIAERPTWVIQLIGTNDARWHGESHPVRTTSLQETIRNVRGIQGLLRANTDAKVITMVPPPIVEADTRLWKPFRAQQIFWSQESLQEIAHELGTWNGVVDLNRVFRSADLRETLQADGVHPTEAGQELILRTLLSALSSPSVGVDWSM